MNPQSNLQQYFLFSIIALVSGLVIFMIIPFFAPILLALVCVVIFYPVHKRIAKMVAHGKTGNFFASFISTVLVLLAVLTPLTFVGIEVSIEAKGMYDYLSTNTSTPIVNRISTTLENISEKVVSGADKTTVQKINFNDYLKKALNVAFTNIDSIFSSAAKILFELVILVIAMFYFFKDGAVLKDQIIKLSPLNDKQDEDIFDHLSVAVNSIIRGTLMVAIIQGILAGIGFMVFGVPSPALWGMVAMVAALIPGLGTSLVLVPGVIYLLSQGQYTMAVLLAIWAGLAVGLIDNFLGPKFMQKGTGIHPLLILLSVVGGLSFFGPIGFLAGPLLVSLLFTLLNVYKLSKRAV